MKIKALTDFFIPNQRGFELGKEYDVTDALGATLLERELVEEVVSKPSVEKAKPEPNQHKQPKK